MSGTETLADWLASRTDEQLVRLLSRRPDLVMPVPASLRVVAGRIGQAASVLRAADDVTTAEFVLLDALAADQHAGAPPPTLPELKKRFRSRLPASDANAEILDELLDRLTDRALVWIDDDKAIHLVPAAAGALPWPAGSSLDPANPPSETQLRADLADISPEQHSILEKLAHTGPRGRTRDAAPDAPADRPVPRLLDRGLLCRVDDETVELPAAVGQLLRGEPVSDPYSLVPPQPPTTTHSPAHLDGSAASEVGELLRHCSQVLEELGQHPAPALRAGGLGVRELRRLAKNTGIPEERLGLLVELLVAIDVLYRGVPDPLPPDDPAEEYWAPTPAADYWAEIPAAQRWVRLATGWLSMDRVPWMIGMRGEGDKPLAALSDDVHNKAAPRDRSTILEVLTDLPAGTALDAGAIAQILRWRYPRRERHYHPDAVRRTLSEAAALGIVVSGAIGSAGRVLVSGDTDSAETIAAAQSTMAGTLPEPVDHVLVQADLTVVAPGPLTAQLQDRISLVAEVESTGAATVYRIGEASVRRALDAGLSAADLHNLFDNHSRTPIPQSLTYLIDDVARRHGRLRIGMAQSFLRSDDPTLLAQVGTSPVAQRLALRMIAPTVAVSPAPLGELFDELRRAGFAPATEDASGAIVDVRRRGSRIAARPRSRPSYRPAAPTTEQLRDLVRELRAADNATTTQTVRPDGTRSGTAATLALLQLAVRVHRPVRIDYVDAQGTARRRVVEPVQVGRGQLEARDPITGTLRQFVLHRVASVALLDSAT